MCKLAEVFAVIHDIVCTHALVYMYSVHVHGVLPVLVCVLVFCLVHVCEHVHVYIYMPLLNSVLDSQVGVYFHVASFRFLYTYFTFDHKD